MTTVRAGELLSVAEAARILKCGEGNVRVLADQRVLRVHARVGPRGDRIFLRKEVEDVAVERWVRALLAGPRKAPKRYARAQEALKKSGVA